MTATEAAKYIRCSYWSILQMVKRKQIPYYGIGNRKLFRKESLDRWLSEQEDMTSNDEEVSCSILQKVKE